MFSISMLQRRDAAADQQAAAAAAMAAWSAGIAYAINFIVLYLTMSLTVVVVVGVMGCLASDRVRKSPTFIILVLATVLCICAVGVDITMYKDLVVNPQKHFSADLYTTVVALFLLIPFLVDFALIFRILAFFPRNSVSAAGRRQWKKFAAIAFPALIKVPRLVFICRYIEFVHSVGLTSANMPEVIARVNQKQYALTEWTLMLADELYCTIFFCVKLYELGWGWGEDKHVSRNFLDTLRKILISAMACFVIPSILLIALIVMQALRYKPDLEGYVFATFVPMTVISAAFATLWPAIRSERRRRQTQTPPMPTLLSQAQSNKFLKIQRSFDTDDEKEIGGNKTLGSSAVELDELDHQVVATLKHRQESRDVGARPGTGESTDSSTEAVVIAVQRGAAPHSPLRHAPIVSGIAITTVTEEQWSPA